MHQLSIPASTVTDRQLAGQVLRVDRFGNLVTNIDRKQFEKFVQSNDVEITVATHRIGRVVATYAEAAANELCALFGSSDHLEIAVNAGSAADQQLSEWMARRPSDEVFARATRLIRAMLDTGTAVDGSLSADDVIKYSESIAAASGGLFGIGKISAEERETLAQIVSALKSR